MKANRTAMNSLFTVLAPVVWGSTYLVTTEMLPPDRPLLAAVLRALPAGLLLFVFSRVLPRGVWWWRALVLGTLNIGAFFYLLFVAAYLLPGGVAALVMSVTPMLVLLLAALLLNDKIRPIHVVACLVAAAGVALLVLQPNAGIDLIGVIAGLAGAICMATGIVLTKRWGRPEEVGLVTFTGWQLTVGGLVLIPALFAVEGLPSQLNGTNLLGFGYLSLIGALFAYLIWFRGISKLPALAVSFLAFGSPLAATLLGYVVLGESLSLLQIVGAFAVVTAVVLAQLKWQRKADDQPDPEAPQQIRTPLPLRS